MNTIIDIEIKKYRTLDYSIIFRLHNGQVELPPVLVKGIYESEAHQTQIKNCINNWREHFVSWEVMKDNKILESTGVSIPNFYLISKDGKAIRIISFMEYFNDYLK